jgi:PadR family transcriptional regulator PadR
MPRESLGEFEHQVLLAILHLGGRAHSAPIVTEMEARSGRAAAPAAVYIALRRLEQRGLVRSAKSEPGRKEGGRGRRTFTVTPAALEKLRDSRRAFEAFWAGLDPLFTAGATRPRQVKKR